MKKNITGHFIFLFCLAGLCSCSKTKTNTSNTDCIERIVLVPGDMPTNSLPVINLDPITSGEIDTIKTLFTNNNLLFGQYQFVSYYSYQYSSDSIQTQVTANPFINGLPVFNDGQIFIFFNGTYSASSSYLTSEVPANNDNTGHQTLSYLRNAFLKYVSEATITGANLNANTTVPSPASYMHTCLSATLGYIDLSFIPGNPFSLGHLIKVWMVTPLNGNYPTVFVRDDNGIGWGVPIAMI